MPARKLILIKHSQPAIDPGLPAAEWPLNDEGRRLAGRLAERLTSYRLQALYSSPEPKAAQTAAILGERLALPPQTVPELHEHLRRSAPFSAEKDFEASIQAFFALPDRLVFGEETAHEAQVRFSRAIQRLSSAHPNQIIAVVAHGTVISLHLSAQMHWTPQQTLAFWKRLGLPGMVVLDNGVITEEFSFK